MITKGDIVSLPVAGFQYFDTFIEFPLAGSLNTFYCDIETGNLYYWDSVAEAYVISTARTGLTARTTAGAAFIDEGLTYLDWETEATAITVPNEVQYDAGVFTLAGDSLTNGVFSMAFEFQNAGTDQFNLTLGYEFRENGTDWVAIQSERFAIPLEDGGTDLTRVSFLTMPMAGYLKNPVGAVDFRLSLSSDQVALTDELSLERSHIWLK